MAGSPWIQFEFFFNAYNLTKLIRSARDKSVLEDSLMETKPAFQSDFYDEGDNIHHSFHGPRKAWKKPSRSPTPVYSSIMFKGFFMCVDCTTTSYLLINSL